MFYSHETSICGNSRQFFAQIVKISCCVCLSSSNFLFIIIYFQCSTYLWGDVFINFVSGLVSEQQCCQLWIFVANTYFKICNLSLRAQKQAFFGIGSDISTFGTIIFQQILQRQLETLMKWRTKRRKKKPFQLWDELVAAVWLLKYNISVHRVRV